MPEFRLTQISDTHLARRLPTLTGNFDRLREYIDARRPDLVVNSGDLAFDGPTHRDDLEFAKALHDALAVPCRTLPGNHDIGDNPTEVGPPLSQPVTEPNRQIFLSIFGEDRWRFDAAGWCFIGLNSLVMNTGLACEAEQFDWLARQLAGTNGKPVALFVHKPLFLNAPDDPELVATSFRFDHRSHVVDRQLLDLGNFVRGAEAVEEMQERNARLQGGGVRNQRQVHRFLHRVGREQGKSGGADGHDILVVAENGQRVRRDRAGGNVDDRRASVRPRSCTCWESSAAGLATT